ncbi:T9SS type B sorting domain-containing protein [Winogradskyella sp. UBA3174]|uniref:T9SS type B sorting domain-containing protein n=1 Tax=Winogradskyella sp. UBA3174 TaxID=1947785 RepID=UPI0025F2770A|nr:T9SS type B sorting domain-containing protein [Winogradskyella sp. UBA3174]|tara:strand:+ start:9035 stop:11644 length:2610 start_codon:yes stop_codon:yes gene_type:complete
MRFFYLCICSFILPAFLFSQNEANIWYFGAKAGLDFNNGDPVVLLDGDLDTVEGCAIISTDSGDLLFYTDGVTVYNRSHQVMVNGTGLNGDFSSSQSAVILPKPGTLNSYYIFTTDADGNENGLQYSEVNLDLDNGLGAVTAIKNIQLFTPTSEQLIVTKKSNIDEYWVISHKFNSDEFIVYDVTAIGVNPNPIISAIGNEVAISNNIGQMKISLQRNRLATARTFRLEVFDFNINTGTLSNVLEIQNPTNFYGVEFSPSGQYLYASYFTSGFFLDGGVVQYNLFNNTLGEIVGSRKVLFENANELFGALQIAPDGNIYIAKVDSPYLDVIESPNELGLLSNYIVDGINLGGRNSIFGLPTFIQPFFEASFLTNNLCLGSDTEFTAIITGDFNSVFWDFGDGTTSNEVNPIHNYTSLGNYTVTMTLDTPINTYTESKIVTIYESFIADDTSISQCSDGVEDGVAIFSLQSYIDDLYVTANLTNVNLRHVKFYEDELLTILVDGAYYENISNPQIIYAEVFHPVSKCVSIAEITLEVVNSEVEDVLLVACDNDNNEGFAIFDLSSINLQIAEDLPLNASLSYFLTYNDAIIQENTLSTTFTNTIPNFQNIYMRIESDAVCYGINEISLLVNESTQLLDSEIIYYCSTDFPQKTTLYAGVLGSSDNTLLYNWSSGETSSQIEVNTIGDFTVSVTNELGCVSERTITVLPSDLPIIDSVAISDFSTSNTITVNVIGDGNFEYALDDINGPYQILNVFENVSPGAHSVYVKDLNKDCGIASEEVLIYGFPKFFTPNADSKNDTWEIKGFSTLNPSTAVVSIYNRYGKLLAVLNSNNLRWDGIYNGKVLPTDDYWFVAKLLDGRTFSGHFTLKN